MSGRLPSAFENELLTLRTRLAELGGRAEEQLAQALDAVSRRDIELARKVVDGDARLDLDAASIEELSLRALAVRQPLAQDLREIVAALRVATTLERVGDLAKSIARRVDSMVIFAPQRIERSIGHMGSLAQAQLADALDAYGSGDIAAAVALWRRDVEIDELFNSLFRDLLVHMTREPRLVEVGAQMMFVAKNLERIGDHTTFLAEMTYYVGMGQTLADNRPKGQPLAPRSAAQARRTADRRDPQQPPEDDEL